MRKHGGWLRKLITPLLKETQRQSVIRSRHVQLEQLESRYVLTAPVANADVAFGEVNTLAEPRDVQILALDNDTDVDSLHSVLKIVEAAGQDVSLETSDVTIPLAHGSLQVIYQNAHLEHFIYTPNVNFTGTETFTYRISDGSPPFSDLATVTIYVNPVAVAGDYTIYEGGLTFDTHEGLVLDGSASRGPGLTYFWSIDSHSIGPVGGSTSPTLPVSWSDLNNIGIVDGGSSTLTLQVQDSNGITATSSTTLDIVDFAPEVSVLDVSPAGEGCGTAPYLLSATFAEPNPLESPLQVWVDWDYDFLTEDFSAGVSPDAEQLTGYIANGVNEFNFPQYSIQAPHTYSTDGSKIAFIWVLAPGYAFGSPISEVGFNLAFIDVVTGGGSPTEDVTIIGAPASSPEGSLINLDSSFSGGCGTPVYAWSVSKDGSNTPYATGADGNFSFTPTDDGSYVVSLTVDGVPATDQTITVENVDPTLTLTGDSSVNEGSSCTLNLSSFDPGADTISSWTINWGDGTQVVSGNPSSVTHTYADGSNNYSISATATDEDGTFAAANPVAVAVNNVAPTLAISGAASINEGSSYTLNLSSSDPGADTIISWTINWGDGTQVVSGNPSSVTHTYADGTPTSSYIISATATDEDGTFAAGNTVAVTVINVAPVVAPITGPSTGVRYQTLTYLSSFSDVSADANATTAWTVVNSAAAIVASGSGTSLNFVPTAVGAYTVNFTVNDQDGGVTTVSLAPVTISATRVASGVLYVGGTAANDTFNFTQTGASQFSLVLNGASSQTFSSITEVRLFGGAGTGDAVTINGDSNTNIFEVRSDRLVLDATPFFDTGIETRTLNALGSGDSVTVFGGSANVNGGSATDTLTMVSGNNDWHITANNAGSINAGQIVFTSIEHLIGGSGQDTFRFDSGVGVSSDVEGGGDADTLNYSAYSSAVSVNLQSGNATRTGGIASIENFIGGAGNDTLTGRNTANSWNLLGATGSLSGGFTFASFENLQGGNQVDTFNVQAGASLTNVVDGNGGDDVLSYGSYGASASVNLATSTATGIGSFASIVSFMGSTAADTLVGRNSNSTWTISGVGTGSVGSTDFSSFESLQGGTANDTFRVNEGVLSGISIAGGNGGGTDKLDYAAYSSATSVNVNLGAGTATGLASVSGIENVAGGDGNDVIRGDGNANMLAGNQGNDTILGGGGNDTLNGNAGRDILIGGDGADTIIGNADEDILIAGTTSFDGLQSALDALLAEWTSASTYAQRTSHIMGNTGGGLNGSILLNGNDGAGQTVFNDFNVDTLTGSAGVDWYFANQDGIPLLTLDIVTDKTAAELWSDTDF